MSAVIRTEFNVLTLLIKAYLQLLAAIILKGLKRQSLSTRR